MKYQFVYLNVVSVCLNELDSVCLNGRAGQGKPSRYLNVVTVVLPHHSITLVCVCPHCRIVDHLLSQVLSVRFK